MTLVDELLAAAVLAGLVLNAALGWWWADPLAGYVLLVYGARVGCAAFVAACPIFGVVNPTTRSLQSTPI